MLSSISLAKTAAPHAQQQGSMSALSASLEDDSGSEDHQLEAAVAVLRFLADLLDAAPPHEAQKAAGGGTHCVDAVMACYPGIILRSLLQHSNPVRCQPPPKYTTSCSRMAPCNRAKTPR